MQRSSSLAIRVNVDQELCSPDFDAAPCPDCGAVLSFDSDLLIGRTIEVCRCGYRKVIVPRRAKRRVKKPRERKVGTTLPPSMIRILELLPTAQAEAVPCREIVRRAKLSAERISNVITVLFRNGSIERKAIPSPYSTGMRQVYLYWRAA